MLPAPNLDDRHFQDLVDDAKRLVQQRCPTWTDHNVSDPGVTLIEAFAQMVDQLIFRLNRVPDLHYIKFLELIGVELRPPAAAQGEVDLLAVRTAAAAGGGPRRDPGGDAADRRQRPRRLHHDPRAGDRAVLVRARRRAPGRRLAGRQHRGARRRRLPLLLLAHRLPATRCWSACPTPCRAARCCSGWTAGCPARASIRAGRRWSGRRGPTRAGRPAMSARTRPAD